MQAVINSGTYIRTLRMLQLLVWCLKFGSACWRMYLQRKKKLHVGTFSKSSSSLCKDCSRINMSQDDVIYFTQQTILRHSTCRLVKLHIKVGAYLNPLLYLGYFSIILLPAGCGFHFEPWKFSVVYKPGAYNNSPTVATKYIHYEQRGSLFSPPCAPE